MSNIYKGMSNGQGMLLDQSQTAFKTTNESTLKPQSVKLSSMTRAEEGWMDIQTSALLTVMNICK